jgi:hypothetical protein
MLIAVTRLPDPRLPVVVEKIRIGRVFDFAPRRGLEVIIKNRGNPVTAEPGADLPFLRCMQLAPAINSSTESTLKAM